MGDSTEGSEGPASDVHDVASVRRFLDLSIDLLAIVDFETKVLELSDSWERLLGYTRAEMLGEPILQYFHPEDLPQIEAELASLLMGGDAVAVPVRIRSAAGDYRWIQGSARVDAASELIFVTAADISVRMELEEALRRQLSLEEEVATIASHLIAADDAEVHEVIHDGLQDIARLLGADRAHFLRGSRQVETAVIEWLDPDTGLRRNPSSTDPVVLRWWENVIRSPEVLAIDDVAAIAPGVAPAEVVEDLRRDDVRSVLVVPLPPHRGCWGFVSLVAIGRPVIFDDAVSSLLRLAGEAFLTALARGDDAIALLDARRELEHRNEELERSNEELERFAYSAAHDLKAPLARIEMALAATPRPDGDAGALMDVARRGASRMRQLIEDLLAFASVGTGASTAEDVDLDELLVQVLADLTPRVEEVGAEVRVAGLPGAWGHRALLGQLFQNLVGNSLKFVREGVTPVVEVSGTTDVRGVAVRVADNGIGIEPARRGDVFGVFTRLNSDDRFPGSGIGLATCAKVVAHHGGQIWVEDGIDGGAAVVVRLPHRVAG